MRPNPAAVHCTWNTKRSVYKTPTRFGAGQLTLHQHGGYATHRIHRRFGKTTRRKKRVCQQSKFKRSITESTRNEEYRWHIRMRRREEGTHTPESSKVTKSNYPPKVPTAVSLRAWASGSSWRILSDPFQSWWKTKTRMGVDLGN